MQSDRAKRKQLVCKIEKSWRQIMPGNSIYNGWRVEDVWLDN
jgi:hypothetical protein